MRLTATYAPVLLGLCLMVLSGSARATTRQSSEFAEVQGQYSFNYLCYLPPGYQNDANTKWPLMVFLHGSGEVGASLQQLSNKGPLLRIEQGRDFPCIVISPLAPTYGWSPSSVDFFIKDLTVKYRVDKDRIYLTGLSMGGFGTWETACIDPSLFAAIAPLCGGGSPSIARALKNTPVWAFHGALDTTVPIAQSQVMIDTIRQAGGNPLFTIYPTLGHDVWTITYANDELYTWMFAQSRATDPVIVRSPEPISSAVGNHAILRVVATGTNLSYRWTRNGTTIPNATEAILDIPSVSDTDEGLYQVTVSNSRGTVDSTPAEIYVGPEIDTPRLTALSVRALAGQNERTLIMGMTIKDSGGWVYAQALGMDGPRLPILLRGVGSTLTAAHVQGAISDPQIAVFSNGKQRSQNDTWAGDPLVVQLAAEKGLGTIATNSLDAALYESLLPGSFSVLVSPTHAKADGIVLAECYEVNGGLAENTPVLQALAARAYVTPADGALIAGFIVAGPRPLKVLIRGVGPTLGSQGVTTQLSDPELKLYTGDNEIARNDNWGGDATLADAFSHAGLSKLEPDSADSALLVTLSPGAYTAVVSSKNNESGIAMVEVYAVEE